MPLVTLEGVILGLAGARAIQIRILVLCITTDTPVVLTATTLVAVTMGLATLPVMLVPPLLSSQPTPNPVELLVATLAGNSNLALTPVLAPTGNNPVRAQLMESQSGKCQVGFVAIIMRRKVIPVQESRLRLLLPLLVLLCLVLGHPMLDKRKRPVLLESGTTVL